MHILYFFLYSCRVHMHICLWLLNLVLYPQTPTGDLPLDPSRGLSFQTFLCNEFLATPL